MTTPTSPLPTADVTGRLIGAAPAVAPPPPLPVAADGPALVVTAELPNTLLLRRADPSRGDDERLVADAHATARRHALDRLAGWLPDLPVERLADHPGELGPTAVAVADALGERLDLVGLADRLLAEHNMGSPKLIVATDGSPEHKVPPATALAAPVGRFDHPHALAGPFAALLADGMTMVVHAAHFHDAALADLTETLAVALGTQVGANLYLSRADAPGFGPHWDDHDVLIVQGEGAKRWQVLEPLHHAPLRPVIGDAISDTVAWEGTLSPGQALYLPRGWGHRVSGSDELSIHATVTLQRLRFDQLAGFTAGMAGFWPLFRADVPFDPRQRVTSYAGSLYDEPGRFGAAVAELEAASALEHGTAQWLAKLPQRRRGRLSSSVAAMRRRDWSTVVLQGSFPGGVVLVDEKADSRLVAAAQPDGAPGFGSAPDGAVRPLLAAGGRLIELDDWAVPALARLVEGEPVAVADLPLGEAPDRPPTDATGTADSTDATPSDEAELAASADRRSLLAAALVGAGIVDVVGLG